MAGRVLCNSCGGRVDVPDGYDRAKIRCPGCGYYAEVPADLRTKPAGSAAPDAAPVAKPVKRKAAAPAGRDFTPPSPLDKRADEPPPPPRKPPPGPNLLDGTDEESDDDVRPYTVPGDGTKKCPACNAVLPLDATFCVKCGGDLSAGRKKKREYEPVSRAWESTATLRQRVQAFLGVQAMNGLMLVLILGTGFNCTAVGFLALNVAMQAFLLGTYDNLAVRRTARGAATLTKTWRVCFVPQRPQAVNWKGSQGVGIAAYHNPGFFDYGMLLFLLSNGLGQMAAWVFGTEIDSAYKWLVTLLVVFPLSFAPAAAWYWFVLRPDRFQVSLCDVYGSTDEVIFRTTDRDVADEICGVVSDCTGLWYKPVL